MLESALAHKLGVPRTLLREFREQNPKHVYRDRRTIHWTDEGVGWVKGELGLKDAGGREPDTFKATVVRADFPNKKLIRAVADVRGMRELIPVRVRDAQMFVKGMEIEIRRDGNGWAVIRQPRQRGKL